MSDNRRLLSGSHLNRDMISGPLSDGRALAWDAKNTDPQKPVCVVVDNSYSTGFNGVILRLNEGTDCLARLLREDAVTARRIRMAGFSFGGGLKAFTDGFVSAAEFHSPRLSPTGDTPMGEALVQICDHLKAFKELCTTVAVECDTAECLVMTDGSPTDSRETLAAAGRAMAELEKTGVARFHAYFVEGCDPSQLDQIFPRPAELLSVEEILPMFRSLSRSLRRVSRRTVHRGYDLQAEIRRDLGRDRHD